MRTIHKYEIPIDQPHRLDLPLGWEVAHLGADFPGSVTAWVLVHLDAKAYPHHFRVVETGHPIEDDERHVASTPIGNRVVHLVVQ